MTIKDFALEFSDAFNSTEDLTSRHRMFATVAEAFAAGAGPFNAKMLVTEVQKLGGQDGLYERLDELDVFSSDPQRKKSRILVQQLIRSGLLEVADPEQMRPAIEYHLIRLYLRTGRVVRSDNGDIPTSYDRASSVHSVTALRSAVEQAMHYSAAGADLTIVEVNDIEWQIARSFCVRDRPRCGGPPRPDKPVVAKIGASKVGACPFASTCDGPRHPAVAALTEPRLAAHHTYY